MYSFHSFHGCRTVRLRMPLPPSLKLVTVSILLEPVGKLYKKCFIEEQKKNINNSEWRMKWEKLSDEIGNERTAKTQGKWNWHRLFIASVPSWYCIAYTHTLSSLLWKMFNFIALCHDAMHKIALFFASIYLCRRSSLFFTGLRRSRQKNAKLREKKMEADRVLMLSSAACTNALPIYIYIFFLSLSFSLFLSIALSFSISPRRFVIETNMKWALMQFWGSFLLFIGAFVRHGAHRSVMPFDAEI